MADVGRGARIFVVLTSVVYVASLALPVFGSDFLGVQAFVLAFVYCWCVPATGLSWFANVALWLGLAYLATESWEAARRCGLIGLALGLTVVPCCWGKEALQAGYFVWLCSMGTLAVGAIHCETREQNRIIDRRRRRMERMADLVD